MGLEDDGNGEKGEEENIGMNGQGGTFPCFRGGMPMKGSMI